MFGVGGYMCELLNVGVVKVYGVDCDLLVFEMVVLWVGEYGDWLELVEGIFLELDIYVIDFDGVVLDLGVLLMQFDLVECGFLFMKDGLFDMWMS